MASKFSVASLEKVIALDAVVAGFLQHPYSGQNLGIQKQLASWSTFVCEQSRNFSRPLTCLDWVRAVESLAASLRRAGLVRGHGYKTLWLCRMVLVPRPGIACASHGLATFG